MVVKSETTVRKVVSIPRDVWNAIEDCCFENRIKTESEAIRRLIELGLKAVDECGAPSS